MKNIAIFQQDTQTKELVLLNLFENKAYIGTSAQADIKINDLRCSGIHALVQDIKSEGQSSELADFEIIDLGNGSNTFYKHKRTKQFSIKSGETFTIGTTSLTIKRIPKIMLDYQNLLPAEQASSEQESPEKKLATASDRQLLEVSLYWGQQLLDSRTFSGKSTISIGSAPGNTFAITLPDRLEQRLAIIRKDGINFKLPSYAKGIFWEGESTYTLDQLREKEKERVKDDANIQAIIADLSHFIRRGDRADILLGEMTLSFRFVIPPEKIRGTVLPKIDYNLIKIYISLLCLIFLMITFLYFYSPSETKVVEVPENLKKVMFEAGIKNAKEKQKSAIGEILAQGGRAKGEEGSSKSQKTPTPEQATKIARKEEKKTPTPENPTPSQSVANTQTINRPDLKALMAKSTSSETSSIAIEGPSTAGNTLSAISGGGLARGSKGLGAGGGGSSIGIGQIQGSSTGGGLGAGDMGLSPNKGISVDSRIEEEIELQDALDPDVINAIIKRYLPQIDHCYQSRLVIKPKLKGKVKVDFTIVASGGVANPKIIESSLKDSITEKCILDKIQQWKFPRPKGGGMVNVKYPFILMTTSDND